MPAPFSKRKMAFACGKACGNRTEKLCGRLIFCEKAAEKLFSETLGTLPKGRR
jgi:hypothetical protein